MSNAIQFLEAMGSNASLGRLSAAEYAAAVAQLDADEAQQQALLDRNHVALNDALDGRPKMYCFVATPDDNEHEADPDGNDEDGDGVPDEDESPYEKE